MMPIAKKHLPFTAWPLEDRTAWARAFEQDVFDDEDKTSHLAKATIVGLRTSYARYLGFLARHDHERLQLEPQARVDSDSIKAFVAHLRESCRDTSVASLLHKLRLTLGLMFPQHEWSRFKTVAKRIDAGAIPRGDRTRGVTSAELHAVGAELMTRSEAKMISSGDVTLEPALHYRDGLIIALLALVPLRRRTLAALTTGQHLVKTGEYWLLDIPSEDTKSNRPLEFPLPKDLSESVSVYLARFRDGIPGARDHDGLWPSIKGGPMLGGAIYDAVRRRTEEALGFPVNLHRFRLAAGNLWSIADPVNVRGVKDLLGQTSFGTTEKHYIASQQRSAGRALAKAFCPSHRPSAKT